MEDPHKYKPDKTNSILLKNKGIFNHKYIWEIGDLWRTNFHEIH